MQKYKSGCFYIKSAAIILVVMALFLSGCKKDKINIGVEAGDLDISQSYFDGHYIAKGESGYYFFGGLGKYIYYFDTSSHQTIPLCNKAECEHNSSDCMAYVADARSYIFYYKSELYWLMEESGKYVLMKCGQDGTNHTRVAELCECSDEAIECVFVNGYIYFSQNVEDAIEYEDKNVKLKRMSLSDNKIEEVYNYTGKGVAIQGLKAYSDNVYSYVTVVEKTGEKTFERKGKGVYVSNVKDNKTEIVVDDSVADYCLDTKNGYFYYYVYNDGLYKVKDGSRERILKATEETGFCNLNFDGNYVYMNNLYWVFYSNQYMEQDNESKETIWIYDNGELKTSIDMKEAGIILGFNGDEEYYFAVVKGMGAWTCFSKKEFFETGKINWIEIKADVE